VHEASNNSNNSAEIKIDLEDEFTGLMKPTLFLDLK
jgi:hypothetical protein